MNQIEDGLLTLLTLVIVFGLLLGGMFIVSKVKCQSKAKALGYNCNYQLFQGCLLIKPDGKRVLLEQLRDFDN